MVDNPWSFDNWSAAGELKNPKAHYECMTLDDIKGLPVGHLAAKDCVLWLWATNPMIPQVLDELSACQERGLGRAAGYWVPILH